MIHKRMIQVYTVNSVYGYGPLHIHIDCMYHALPGKENIVPNYINKGKLADHMIQNISFFVK